MIIKKRNVLSWLLDENYKLTPKSIAIPGIKNPALFQHLNGQLNILNAITQNGTIWGLPEIIMPSFAKVMEKSYNSFAKIDHEIICQLCEDRECGILIDAEGGTIVYGCHDNKIQIWCFTESNGISGFYAYFEVVSLEGNKRRVDLFPPLLEHSDFFKGTKDEKEKWFSELASKIVTYLAVKKYVKVETVVIPLGKFTEVEGTPLEYVEKKKVINNTGQKVIVMDSKWFRKIINNNEIFVRGFFRMQNKKNAEGEWYKELIFVDSFIRHGYHRDAKIEDEPDYNTPDVDTE